MKNQVQLIGNLGIDPEITQYETGKQKVRFTLATQERFVDKNGNKRVKTFWHNLHAWGNTASYIAKAGKKGMQMAITGKLVSQDYISSTGKQRKFTSIEVRNAVSLG